MVNTSTYDIKITNAIIDDGRIRKRDLMNIDRIIIHRIDLGTTAEEIGNRFTTDPELIKILGGDMPYSMIVRASGLIEQTLPISEVGPHAVRWNVPGIGIGMVGDFRRYNPSDEQWVSAVKLCTVISQWLKKPDAIFGHDELPDATKSPGKQCPGSQWNMDKFREAVMMTRRAKAYGDLIVSGCVF